MNPDPEIVYAICSEIDRVQGLHDAALYEDGDTAFHTAISWGGEAIGLRKALCVLYGWPMEAAAKEGRADQLYEKWLEAADGVGPVRPGEEPTT
jgi:hypothetical protein